MSAYVPIAELAGCVFPYDERPRAFMTLRCYLDDSGTHDHSDVVVMAGLVATEEAWARLEPQWDALRREYGIRKFHMNKLIHRPWNSDYRGWSDLKAARVLTRFRGLIEETGGRMLASAVSRKVWNSVCARTRLAEAYADPIDFLQGYCLRHALETKRSKLIMGEERVSVIFDRRLQNIVTWNETALSFKRRYGRKLAGYSFGLTEDVLPLQAADMIAYEAYGFECDQEKLGAEPKPRPNFKRLMNNLENRMGYFTEKQLLEFGKKVDGILRSKEAR